MEPEPSTAFDARKFRDALGNYATGITIISTVGSGGALIGITANSFNWASRNPPLVLFSLARQATSLTAFRSHGHFAVNVLREGQEKLSHHFAVPSDDKWAGIDYEICGSGCPILSNALTRFECRLRNSYDGGDHVIFVGEVQQICSVPDARPLIFHRGTYTSMRADP